MLGIWGITRIMWWAIYSGVKCQSCGKMFAVERHAKLHEVKNMDGSFNPNKLCEKDFSSYPHLSI